MHRTVTVASDLALAARSHQLPFLAAAIAYYAFLSVVPLLIIGLTLATALAGEQLAARLVESFDTFLNPEATVSIEEALVQTPGRNGVTIFGLIVLLWGSLRVFRGLDIAFSRVYRTEFTKSLSEQLRDAVIVFVAVTLAIGATATVGTLLSLAPAGLSGPAGTVGLMAVLPAVFFPLYYVYPAADVTAREALPGAVFAGVSWTVLGAVFGIYAAYAGSFQLYGVLGGVLLLLVWFYLGGLVLLVGVTLNAVLAGRFEDRQLQHGGPRDHSQRATMSDSGPADDAPREEREDSAADEFGDSSTADSSPSSPGVTRDDLDDLRAQLDEFEREIDNRTLHRDEIERDLQRYIRRRTRRGHARGWGPYLVLLYGTAMTIGAFAYLGGGWAILAMIVIWLSTLGLYVLMVIVGLTSAAFGLPGSLLGRLGRLRDRF